MIIKTRLMHQTTNAQLNISGNGNQGILNIQTTKPKLSMQSTKSKLSIDQTDCFAEMSLKNNSLFLAETISFANSKLSSGIARNVDQGNSLIDIHLGADVLADQADYNAFGMFEKQMGGEHKVPFPRPKTSFTPASLNYSLERGRFENDSRMRLVRLDYRPGKVNFYTRTV